MGCPYEHAPQVSLISARVQKIDAFKRVRFQVGLAVVYLQFRYSISSAVSLLLTRDLLFYRLKLITKFHERSKLRRHLCFVNTFDFITKKRGVFQSVEFLQEMFLSALPLVQMVAVNATGQLLFALFELRVRIHDF